MIIKKFSCRPANDHLDVTRNTDLCECCYGYINSTLFLLGGVSIDRAHIVFSEAAQCFQQGWLPDQKPYFHSYFVTVASYCSFLSTVCGVSQQSDVLSIVEFTYPTESYKKWVEIKM